MSLEQSTPPSSRRRWQGTRTSFIDLVLALERCMRTAGVTDQITLMVKVGDHEGRLLPQDLRNELTEALWLGSQQVTVMLSPDDYRQVSLSLMLGPPEPVLYLTFQGGTTQTRETLRAVVERALPAERSDTRRNWRWVGPVVGCAYSATIVLLGNALPATGVTVPVSQTFANVLVVLSSVANVAFGAYWTRLAFSRWFPPLERLPDKAETYWDRRRTWVQVFLGLWFSLVLGLLALPAVQ